MIIHLIWHCYFPSSPIQSTFLKTCLKLALIYHANHSIKLFLYSVLSVFYLRKPILSISTYIKFYTIHKDRDNSVKNVPASEYGYAGTYFFSWH